MASQLDAHRNNTYVIHHYRYEHIAVATEATDAPPKPFIKRPYNGLTTPASPEPPNGMNGCGGLLFGATLFVGGCAGLYWLLS